MTDAEPLCICGNPAIAAILAEHIDAGRSDATKYVGECFADFQGLAIQQQINSGKGDAEALRQLGLLPQVATAIATAINAKERA